MKFRYLQNAKISISLEEIQDKSSGKRAKSERAQSALFKPDDKK